MWVVDLPAGIAAPVCVRCGKRGRALDARGRVVCGEHFSQALGDVLRRRVRRVLSRLPATDGREEA